MTAGPCKMTMCNVGRNTLNVCQGPKGGLEEPLMPQGIPPTPILEKTLGSRKSQQMLYFAQIESTP